jgi:acyl dehydratase
MALLETNMKFVNPLFLGDTFHVDLEVLEKRDTSKPDRGILKFLHHIDKIDGTRVAIITKTRMVRRLSAGS